MAAAARARRLKEEEIERLMTCEVCKVRPDTFYRTIRVAGVESKRARCLRCL